MPSPIWSYVTPGIPDEYFENLPGIPMSQREVRLLLLSHLRLREDSILWDVGAGTGTIPVEAGLLCPNGRIVAVERDEEVASLIRRNCDRFGVTNVRVLEGVAPDCIGDMGEAPDRICFEGGRPIKPILSALWERLKPGGRLVTTAGSLEGLYQVSECLAQLQVRNVEVVQSGFNRLEKRGLGQVFVAVDPIFVLSGEKLDS
jgi:cobalt-precorrin-6B (C15)-methyltransferase